MRARIQADTTSKYLESEYDRYVTSLKAKEDEKKRERWFANVKEQLAVVRNTTRILEESPAGKKRKQILDAKEKNAPKPQSVVKKLITRLIFGWAMIFAFFGIIRAGHKAVIVLVTVLQVLTFRELANVRYKAFQARHVPMFRTIQWCWFATAMCYVHNERLFRYLRLPGTEFLPFTVYVLMFCVTVLSFKKGYYKYQMKQLAWTFITVFLIVFQMKFAAENIMSGLFWFLLPSSLVVANDCWAYFCGISFGKRIFKSTFMRLSPKKTWEGFIGAFFFTCIFAFVYPLVLQDSWLICPESSMQSDGSLSCDPNPVFVPTTYELPGWIASLTYVNKFTILPVQLHSVLLGMFASVVAPFGGFFASAIKRAYDIKDFDALIPGHGGIMDRMDCQFIMAMATGVHLKTFIMQTDAVETAKTMISALDFSQVEEIKAWISSM